MEFYQFDSPIGTISISEEDGRMIRVYLPNMPTPRLMPHETPLLLRARDEILEYLAGDRKEFDLPYRLDGTPFQQQVWTALAKVPYGGVTSYRKLAETIGAPTSFRAVGGALNRNPLPLLIPCHRVLGADGSLTGYVGGLDLKERLLELESR